MILGNSKTFKGTGYVCFLDVLGFSNDILQNWNAIDSNPLEKLLLIKNNMPVSNVEANDDSRENHRIYTCRVNMISDSVTICFGYTETIIMGDLVLGLEALLSNISYIWSMFINNGYTIRGAIDFGNIYWDENELIGPAFINAYRLEAEVSRNSRVIVSSSFNKLLKDMVTRYKSSLTDHVIENFRKDIDGYIIVNPKILYQTESEKNSLINSLIRMRDNVPNEIVREKYNPLINMLRNDNNIDLKNEDVGNY